MSPRAQEVFQAAVVYGGACVVLGILKLFVGVKLPWWVVFIPLWAPIVVFSLVALVILVWKLSKAKRSLKQPWR